MHFILISKKESFKNEQINDNLLNSLNAPSLISREAVKFEIADFILYIYPYNHIDKEIYGYSYYKDKNKVLLCNGLVNINNSLRNPDIYNFFEELNDSSKLIGDYQLVSIDNNGNGFIKTPPLSLRQLFFYEDENCEVLSTEIKLIVDGIKKFRKMKFVNHFDVDFIEDSLFREWNDRRVPQSTIFKEIKRIFPQDLKYFRKNIIITKRKESIKVPKWFRNAYNKDKNKFYDDYCEILMNFAENNLVYLKPNIEKFFLGLTGGFDSRLSVAILSKLCKKHQIPLLCYTSGQLEHPDVVIAKKIINILDIEYFHHLPLNNRFMNTNTYDDYALSFYMSQGDFNSKDFVPCYERKMSLRLSPLSDNAIPPAIGAYPTNESEIYQIGMDTFKRITLDRIIASNRWYARRIFSQGNFFFPLFSTKYETWLTLLYSEKEEGYYKEFIYEMLKRLEPKLLDIPSVGDSLPQVNVEPYLSWRETKHHEKEPFLWDYNYVRTNLKPVLIKKFDELDKNGKSFLKLVGLNELDYFISEEICKIIDSYHKKQINLKECFKALLKERLSINYLRTKSMVVMTKERREDPYISKMQILMDFASVSDKKSFGEIEDNIGALNFRIMN